MVEQFYIIKTELPAISKPGSSSQPMMSGSSNLTAQFNVSKAKEKLNSLMESFDTMHEKLHNTTMQQDSTKNKQQVVVKNSSPLNNLTPLECNENKGGEEVHNSSITSRGLPEVVKKIEVSEGLKDESHTEGLRVRTSLKGVRHSEGYRVFKALATASLCLSYITRHNEQAIYKNNLITVSLPASSGIITIKLSLQRAT
ncbi:uncharacterized protein G2W53_041042 [Senna tora]|uniref:Uncharacterized protein n=1 Tax=Senna tora TaxID=362788 RepID=A0A834SEH2_9FABA|nr:uncharacterized protein G2W53_041042 [Senna tora]